MAEVDLHKAVIFPLLRAMGFQHVQYVHGAFERGKDIIYNASDEFGDPLLSVCQVKNAPFSGDATSENNTLAALNQLRQCRVTQVLDPLTNTLQLPQRVLLLSTFIIPDKDVAGVGRLLDALRAEGIECKGPDKPADLIRQKLPALYSSIAFPGAAIMDALNSYVNTHHEYSAFHSSRMRPLASFSSFFTALSVVLPDTLMEHVASGSLVLRERRGAVFDELRTSDKTSLKTGQPTEIPSFRILTGWFCQSLLTKMSSTCS